MDPRFVRARDIVAAAMLSGALVSAAAAQSPLWTSFNGGDVAFDALTNGGQLLQGATESRIGNRTDSGAWELGIWRSIPSGPFLSIGQLPRVNAQTIEVVIAYDGASSLSWRVGGALISTSQLGGPFTDIFVRTRSAVNGSIRLSSLQFNASGLAADLVSSGDATVNYLRLSNGSLPFGPFEIRGFETLSWVANDPPVNSAVNAQFRFTNVIPAPGLSAVGVVAGLWSGRRRRR
ncbi:MAG: choice-of-anchor W domain-containing protein [Phycisphaerae bacterium]|jgi:hypothetical protein